MERISDPRGEESVSEELEIVRLTYKCCGEYANQGAHLICPTQSQILISRITAQLADKEKEIEELKKPRETFKQEVQKLLDERLEIIEGLRRVVDENKKEIRNLTDALKEQTMNAMEALALCIKEKK